MPSPEEQVSIDGLAQLKSHPLTFLQTNAFTAQGFIGQNAYRPTDLSFLLSGTKAKMGPLGQFTSVEEQAAAVNGQTALVTPMRASTANTDRLIAMPRFANGVADLWLTVRLSGCAIMVVDWGGEFSMVHLQPFGQGTWNRMAQKLMAKSDSVYKEMTRYSLQGEMTAIVNASATSGAPKKYILVFSQYRTGHRSVTGVAGDDGWTFFRQDYSNEGLVHNTAELQWTDWSSWKGYVPSGF